MARDRSELNTALEFLCENVYFQPPSNVKMTYPAIVYQRDTVYTDSADNGVYRDFVRYQLTVISRNPDEPLVEQLRHLPLCRHQRFFVADNLNHDVFNIYF